MATKLDYDKHGNYLPPQFYNPAKYSEEHPILTKDQTSVMQLLRMTRFILWVAVMIWLISLMF